MEFEALIPTLERAVAAAPREILQEWSVAIDAALQCDYLVHPQTGETMPKRPQDYELFAHFQQLIMERLNAD